MIFIHYYENLSYVHFLTKQRHICEAWVDHHKNSLKYYYPHFTAQETEVQGSNIQYSLYEDDMFCVLTLSSTIASSPTWLRSPGNVFLRIH